MGRFSARGVANAVGMRSLDQVPRPRLLSTPLSRLRLSAADPVSPRLVFDPAGGSVGGDLDLASSASMVPRPNSIVPASLADLVRPRVALAKITGFYRDRLAWASLLITSVTLCYVAGLVMFYYHTQMLGEGGPAISWYAHWLLDSTVGFIALTPALLLLLPAGAMIAKALAPSERAVPWLFSVAVGIPFAFLTMPGPLVHDVLVGRGTWLANRVTNLIGNPHAVLTASHHYPWDLDLTQQIALGLPLYVLMTRLAVMFVQSSVATSRRHAAVPVVTAD